MNKIENENLKDVGILLPENPQVLAVFNYLQTKGQMAGVRYSENQRVHEALDFSGNIPNIMPYHSSKGLQFETVFMPFCGSNITGIFWRNPFYVALTRTVKTLIITYTGLPSSFFHEIDRTLYQII